MFSIFLLIAAFQTGNGLTILFVATILGYFWSFIISEIKRSTNTKGTYQKKQNPIDKHGDENYGTIDWLRNGKL